MSVDRTNIKIKVPVKSTFQAIKLWNGIYDLTEKEITILAVLIDTKAEEFCSKKHREDVALATGSKQGIISTYIKRLKDKHAITHKNGVYEYSKLFKELNSVEVSILRGDI
jgi:hypothetical protein